MPKSKSRARGHHVARRPHVPKAALIEQRRMSLICDDLDRLMSEVPAGYRPDSLDEAVAHHHATTAVVNYLRRHDVVSTLARLAGGHMIVTTDGDDTQPVADPPAPVVDAPKAADLVWAATRRKGICFHEIASYDPPRTVCGRSTASATSIELTRDGAEGSGMVPCPSCWPETIDLAKAARGDRGRNIAEGLPYKDQLAPEEAAPEDPSVESMAFSANALLAGDVAAPGSFGFRSRQPVTIVEDSRQIGADQVEITYRVGDGPIVRGMLPGDCTIDLIKRGRLRPDVRAEAAVAAVAPDEVSTEVLERVLHGLKTMDDPKPVVELPALPWATTDRADALRGQVVEVLEGTENWSAGGRYVKRFRMMVLHAHAMHDVIHLSGALVKVDGTLGKQSRFPAVRRSDVRELGAWEGGE